VKGLLWYLNQIQKELQTGESENENPSLRKDKSMAYYSINPMFSPSLLYVYTLYFLFCGTMHKMNHYLCFCSPHITFYYVAISICLTMFRESSKRSPLCIFFKLSLAQRGIYWFALLPAFLWWYMVKFLSRLCHTV
jgi:hypothetical protein